jgi:hypothetical protein
MQPTITVPTVCPYPQSRPMYAACPMSTTPPISSMPTISPLTPTVRTAMATCEHRPYPLSVTGEAKPVFSSPLLVASHTASLMCSATPCTVHHYHRAAGSSAIKSSYSYADLAVDQSFIRELAAAQRGVAKVPPSATEVIPIDVASGLHPTRTAPPQARPRLHDALRTRSRLPRPRYRAAVHKSPSTECRHHGDVISGELRSRPPPQTYPTPPPRALALRPTPLTTGPCRIFADTASPAPWGAAPLFRVWAASPWRQPTH